MATQRLRREIAQLEKSPPPLIRAKPLENNILTFYYVLEGPKGTPYEGGHYFGKLVFPSEYPMKPPSVIMITPSGRFQPNARICMSMSDFHPESWNPSWSVANILIGLQSFMVEKSPTVGSVETSDAVKQRYARESLAWTIANDKNFAKLFPDLVELHNSRRSAAAAAAAVAGEGGAAGGAGGDATVAGGAGAADGTAPGRSSAKDLAILMLIIGLAVVAALMSRSSS